MTDPQDANEFIDVIAPVVGGNSRFSMNFTLYAENTSPGTAFRIF